MKPSDLTITPDPRLSCSSKYRFSRSLEVLSTDSTSKRVAVIPTTEGDALLIALAKDVLASDVKISIFFDCSLSDII